MRLCFIYLTQQTCTKEGDAVAKFHLSNGAQLYNINWAADLSKKRRDTVEQSDGELSLRTGCSRK